MSTVTQGPDDATLAGGELEGDTPLTGRSLGRRELEDARRLEALLRSDEPTRLGHYVLLDKLGEGGMGVVFAAYDERLDRKVALKLLLAQGRGDAHSRLIREAQALARLSHPNVVQIYEIAEREGLDFLVMEFIEGETLGRWRARTEPSRAELLEVFAAAGRGLAAAHDKGLVHRDFKPGNVMICADGRVVVMDFGLAREGQPREGQPKPLEPDGEPELEPDGASEPAGAHTGGARPRRGSVELTGSSQLSTELTRTGALMGTPAYMSPEQLRGDPSDASTDQWSFCVALWEALHGRRPFEGENLGALTLAVLEDRRGPIGAELPSWLQQIIERGLSQDPRARWPSMHALLAALASDPTQRRRRWMLAGAAAGVLASVGLGAQLWTIRHEQQLRRSCASEAAEIHALWGEPTRARYAERFEGTPFAGSWARASGWLDDYASEWAQLRERSCLATRLEHSRDAGLDAQAQACLDEGSVALGALLEVWASADDRVVAHASLAAAGLPPIAACEDRSWLAQRVELPREPELRAEIVRLRAALERARAEVSATAYAVALARAKAALRDAEALGWDPLIAEALYRLAECEAEFSLFERARAHYEQADLRATATAHDLLALRASIALSSTVGYMMADSARGLEWAERAAAMLERTGLRGSVDEAHYQDALGNLYWSQGDFQPSMEAFERAREIYSEALGPSHPSTAKQLENLAYLDMELANYERSGERFEAARELLERSLGAEDPNVAVVLTYLGDLRRRQGQPAQAAALHERALAILEGALGPTHTQLSDVLNNLGVAYTDLGRAEDALAVYERALHINEAAFGPTHGQIGTTVNNIAIIHTEAGDYDAARPHYERALAIAKHNHGPDHPRVGIGHYNLGKLELDEGRFAVALAHIERAREVFRAAFGPEHPNTQAAGVALARAAFHSGDLERARELYEQALPFCEAGESQHEVNTKFGYGELLFALGQTQRGRALVLEARALVLERELTGRSRLEPIDAWLAEHPAPQGGSRAPREVGPD